MTRKITNMNMLICTSVQIKNLQKNGLLSANHNEVITSQVIIYVDERNAMNELAIPSGRCMCISPVKL